MTEAESSRRYLTVLEVEEEPPLLGHIRRLVRSQLRRVPFENVAVHAGIRTDIVLRALVDLPLKGEISA